MVNWESNVFPGILGRTCDRPCEPACRRGRVEENNEGEGGAKPEPVAICRLKRVAADYKGDIRGRLPRPAKQRNGKRVACVGAGPASLTVARDLAPLGEAETIIGEHQKWGLRPLPRDLLVPWLKNTLIFVFIKIRIDDIRKVICYRSELFFWHPPVV